MDGYEHDGLSQLEKISENEVITAVDALQFEHGGIENAASIVSDELKTLALQIHSLKSQPSNKRIVTFEGAARSGKSLKIDMLKEAFNALGVNSLFLDCQKLENQEEQKQIEHFSIILKKSPSIIFLDEVMALTPGALAFLKQEVPNVILVLTMGYNVRTVDVFSIQKKWQELVAPSSLEPIKFISNSFWNRSQVDEYVRQRRDTYNSAFMNDELFDDLDDEGWKIIAEICNVVSLGHPWLLSAIFDIFTSIEWEDYFEQLGEEELYSVGRFLMREVRLTITNLSQEATSDGKLLLSASPASSSEVFSDSLNDLLNDSIPSLNSALRSIISPQSFQHLQSQLLLKMMDLSDLVLEARR